MLFFFFFSSRRRHTRCSRDWSSDVCSSDLLHQALAMTPQRADRTNQVRWAKAASQQAYGMQILNPLTVRYISLPTWNIAHILCVDKIHLKSAAFEYLIERDPVNARRLHRHRSHTACTQPFSRSL